jgi:hypothetical protein
MLLIGRGMYKVIKKARATRTAEMVRRRVRMRDRKRLEMKNWM